ncbi:hypothetical protein FIBSPDRAFT_499322 [Athelia psychrophila]|uniref:Uncharacterized protein n=1 Tax=Athelia psychrophila TaxID=1759441 RepID=A0A166K9E5_9AGAM|nr:hypothetical protein FIBSPDRAFT_499322 [Fibularhizoctonia sp. CBS 109695]
MAIPVETTELRFTSDYCYLIVWVLRPPPLLPPRTTAHLGCQGCQHGHPKRASVFFHSFRSFQTSSRTDLCYSPQELPTAPLPLPNRLDDNWHVQLLFSTHFSTSCFPCALTYRIYLLQNLPPAPASPPSEPTGRQLPCISITFCSLFTSQSHPSPAC